MKTKLIAVLTFVAFPLLAQQAPPAPDFAPFGIIVDWTARINAVMGAEPHLYPGPCRGSLIANVEVYNNASGETQFVVPGAIQ